MKKKDFLTIYAEAHAKTMTAENIKAVFRKTGTWPVNPNVITPEMMAPSKTTSMEGHLPIVPPTPVRVVSNLLSDLLGILIQEDLESDEDAGLDRNSRKGREVMVAPKLRQESTMSLK